MPLLLHIFLLLATVQGSDSSGSMILIPAGDFVAGLSASESSLPLPAFFIDPTEVTQKEYSKVTGKNPSFFMGDGRPVEKVNWFDAAAYCEKLGKRLPTEWEWEKAARAGTRTKYYWGNAAEDAYAWFKDNADQQTHPVGLKKPNPFGLYDMAGNVWEWTASDFGGAIPGKVLRGGSWRNGSSSLRSSSRITSLPHFQYHYAGFRCARDADTN